MQFELNYPRGLDVAGQEAQKIHGQWKELAMVTRIFPLLLLVSLVSLAGCNAYTGVSARDGEVYLTGTTSFLIFGTAWVKKCTPDGAKLTCEDVVITQVGSAKTAGTAGSGSTWQLKGSSEGASDGGASDGGGEGTTDEVGPTRVMVKNNECVLVGESPLHCDKL